MPGTEITLTPMAAEEIRKLMAKEGYQSEGYLRLGVRDGGCAGLSYVMRFDSKAAEDDQVFESQGVKIACNTQSYFSLAGIELDFDGGLMGSGFVFNNPNAVASCGCGKSFS